MDPLAVAPGPLEQMALVVELLEPLVAPPLAVPAALAQVVVPLESLVALLPLAPLVVGEHVSFFALVAVQVDLDAPPEYQAHLGKRT